MFLESILLYAETTGLQWWGCHLVARGEVAHAGQLHLVHVHQQLNSSFPDLQGGHVRQEVIPHKEAHEHCSHTSAGVKDVVTTGGLACVGNVFSTLAEDTSSNASLAVDHVCTVLNLRGGEFTMWAALHELLLHYWMQENILGLQFPPEGQCGRLLT